MALARRLTNADRRMHAKYDRACKRWRRLNQEYRTEALRKHGGVASASRKGKATFAHDARDALALDPYLPFSGPTQTWEFNLCGQTV